MVSSAQVANALLIVVCAFFGFWTLFSIVGGIHYAEWPPRFDLKDLHIRSLNVSTDRKLRLDMDILIQMRKFSPIRTIEEFSYEVRTSHYDKRIGMSSVDGFHPIKNATMDIVTTQRQEMLYMGDWLGDRMREDLNWTGRLSLRIYMRAQIYTPLFLAMKKRVSRTCDLIVTPGAPFGSQIYERRCCPRLYCPTADDRCFTENCCQLPPSDPRSVISICG
uniref:Uncharacterized protein n=1 Tax=Physcomitrium patens TaxID=3218 RepID=A0A2K1K7S0_PHYPA|nr:hypothetical protein PHYPA_011713 [Physcomitrium patens]